MIKCEANLKQWGLIAAMYTEDWDGELWPSAPGTPCYWWVRYLDDRYKDWKANKLWLCPSAQKPEWDEAGVRRPVLNIYNAWGIYKGDRLGPNGICGSYGINGYTLIPYPKGGGAKNYEGGVPVANGWKTAYTAGAGNVPLFTEALRFDFWPLETQGPAPTEATPWAESASTGTAVL